MHTAPVSWHTGTHIAGNTRHCGAGMEHSREKLKIEMHSDSSHCQASTQVDPCGRHLSAPPFIPQPQKKSDLLKNLHSDNVLPYLPPPDRPGLYPAIALLLPLSLPLPHLFPGDSSFKCHFPAAVAVLLCNTKFFLAGPGLVQADG